LQGASLSCKRAKRKFLGQQVLFGTKFPKFGPKRANLATLTTIAHNPPAYRTKTTTECYVIERFVKTFAQRSDFTLDYCTLLDVVRAGLQYWRIYGQIPEIWQILKAFGYKYFGLANFLAIF